MTRRRAVVLACVPALAVGGCSSSAGQGAHVTVFAAASLREAFTRIGAEFEKNHPGTTVSFTFAGSADLVTQIQQGARADIVATADERTMGRLSADRLVRGAPVAFATNTVHLAVPAGNPAHIHGLQDLGRSGVRLVVCARQVPCGSAAARTAAAAGVTLKPVSEEQSVTDVVNKLRTGEADAGLVYVTDVRAGGGSVMGIAIPRRVAAVTRYPIALLSDDGPAKDLMNTITGDLGRRTLGAAGFGRP